MTKILRKIKDEKGIEDYLKPIQTLFFSNYKDPKVALAKDAFEKKVLCLESLGKCFRSDQQQAFFEHFEKVLQIKMNRPAAKKDSDDQKLPKM